MTCSACDRWKCVTTKSLAINSSYIQNTLTKSEFSMFVSNDFIFKIKIAHVTYLRLCWHNYEQDQLMLNRSE